MFKRFLPILLVAALFAPSASAASMATQKFPLPNMGHLELVMPKEWKNQLRQPPQDLPPTITLSPATGNTFQILITPFWAVRPGVVVPGKEDMRKSLTHAAEEAKAHAVEKAIPLKEMTGSSGLGYYFSATDKAPKPGEFKYMTQGMLRSGELALMFTVLTNDGGEGAFAQAMEMLKGAKHVR